MVQLTGQSGFLLQIHVHPGPAKEIEALRGRVWQIGVPYQRLDSRQTIIGGAYRSRWTRCILAARAEQHRNPKICSQSSSIEVVQSCTDRIDGHSCPLENVI